jgi:hypothetical protein
MPAEAIKEDGISDVSFAAGIANLASSLNALRDA